MAEDTNFGPHHPGLFDFTILFEQSILSLLPTCIFILLVPLRISVLWKHEKATKPGILLWSKLVSDLSSWGMALTPVLGHPRKLCLSPNSSRRAVEHRLSID